MSPPGGLTFHICLSLVNIGDRSGNCTPSVYLLILELGCKRPLHQVSSWRSITWQWTFSVINLVAIFGHVLCFSNWKIFSRWRLRWRNKVCLIFSPPPPPFNFKTRMLSHRETNPFGVEIFLVKKSSLFVGVWRGGGSGLEGWCKKRLQEGKREVINYLCRLSTLTLKSSFLAF